MDLDTTRAPQVAGMIQQRQKRMRKEARPFELDAPEEFQRCESSLRIYLKAWFSPRRFRRSRKRRCNGGGVLGLKATRYQSGWLRSRLSQVNVEASALGCRATFSRIAPYGCFASLLSVLALARGCSLIRRSR